jgi:hypothetical protein
VPIKLAKTNDVAKMTDVIPAEHKEYFSTAVNRFSGAGENTDAADSQSELWDSDN